MKYKFSPFRQIEKFYSHIIRTTQAVEEISNKLSQPEMNANFIAEYPKSSESTGTPAAAIPVVESSGKDSASQAEMESLRANLARSMPQNPVVRGWSSYSQCDEDGIIRECLKRISMVSPLSWTFVEFGCADGLENNTHQLALDGYAGCWIDGDVSKIGFIENQLGNLGLPGLRVICSFVTLESIERIVLDCRAFLATEDIDFFSFDIDGNDTHLVREALKSIRPKLVCVEYNAKFRPPTRAEMAYSATHRWEGDDYFGASLQTWVETLEGYSLVACNLSGANAFFVRGDLAGVFAAHSVEELHQPPRYWLATGGAGHPPSLKWLRQAAAGRNIDRPWIVQARVRNWQPFDFEIHRRADRYVSEEISRNQIWEPFETEVFCRLCRAGDFVLDIGSNIGWYSVLAARIIGSSGRLLALEPDPDNFGILARNMARCGSGSVELRQIAAGEASSEVELFLSDSNLGDHRLFDDGSRRSSIRIPMLTLDALLAGEMRLPTIVKCDTQGSEARILLGARETLRKAWRPIFLLEFWPFGLSGSGSDPLALWQTLQELGYRMYEVSEANPRLKRLTDERVRSRMSSDIAASTGGFINILALPSGSDRQAAIEDLID